MNSKTVSLPTGGKVINAQLFTPKATGNGGVVVLAYGSDGMSEPWAGMILDYAGQLAQQNFSVVVPDYLASTGTAPGLAVFDQIGTHRDEWQAALEDAINYAKAIPGTDSSRIGLLGFSLGGHLSLRARHAAKVLVEFFAPEFSQIGGIGQAAKAVSRAQIHHGSADQLVPFSNADAIQKRLKAEGSASDVFRYDGAGHGFAGADPSNDTARRSARERTLSFFAEHL